MHISKIKAANDLVKERAVLLRIAHVAQPGTEKKHFLIGEFHAGEGEGAVANVISTRWLPIETAERLRVALLNELLARVAGEVARVEIKLASTGISCEKVGDQQG